MQISKYLVGISLLWGGLGIAQAATITPDAFSATIGVGETITVDKTVTIETGDVASMVDFYFLADNTGSMGGVISSVRSVAGDLLTALSSTYSDAAFGVGSYYGDPGESFETPDSAYNVLTTSTTDTVAVQAGINSWVAASLLDAAEQYYRNEFLLLNSDIAGDLI